MMKNKDEIRDELKDLSPFLWKQKGKPEGFDVPKDYFKSLPDEVFAKLNEQPQAVVDEKENWLDQLVKSLQCFFQPKYALAYATAALLLVAGFYFLNNSNDAGTQPIAAAELLTDMPDEVLDSYISENIDEFDETILAEQVADNIERPLNNLEIENEDELMDELMDGLDVEDLEDLL